jgi:imidazoleglycerol-phosphate dehydratase
MRTADIRRDTKETRIAGSLRIEGRGRYEVATGSFLRSHARAFTKHGGFDLKLKADGDLDVDQHHTVEDVGIVLGQLFAKASGRPQGHQSRRDTFVLPMDETLAVVALDLGGRPALVYKDLVKVRLVGDLQTELVEDFFGGFRESRGAEPARQGVVRRVESHKIEAIFKCFARAMKYAVRRIAAEGPTAVHQGLL